MSEPIQKMMPREAAKAKADREGKFWLPCPICGEPFAGFEWAETLSTLINNNLRVYTENKFQITSTDLVYYRLPKQVQINGCVNPSTGIAYTADQSCEFADDIAEILVDEASAILAGDIESMTQYQRDTQNSQRNS